MYFEKRCFSFFYFLVWYLDIRFDKVQNLHLIWEAAVAMIKQLYKYCTEQFSSTESLVMKLV